MSIESVPVWEWCWIFFSLLSSVVHCFVLFTILRSKQNSSNSLLKGPFFTLVVIQGIHELLEVATVNGFNRLRKYRIIKYAVEEDNNVVEFQWYWFIFLKNILYMGHLLIAANRLSALLLRGVHKYDRMWSTRNIVLMVCVGYAISILLRLFIFDPNATFTTMIFNGTDLFSFEQSSYEFTVSFRYFHISAHQFENSSDICLSTGSAIICATFYIMCFAISRKNGFSRLSADVRRQERTLLKCGVATFIMMIPTSIRSGIELYSQHGKKNQELMNFIVRWNMLPAEAMCVFQPWLILITCSVLRRAMFGRKTTVSEMSNSHQHIKNSVTHS